MVSISNYLYSKTYISGTNFASTTQTPSKTAETASSSPPAGDAAKSFAQVALDARAAINAGYQKLETVGNTKTTAHDWKNTVGFGDLDRRSLYAIASNQGGLFSDQEINQAEMEMANRISDVLLAANPLNQDPAAGYKAVIDYLDAGSSEELVSIDWAQERASAQWGYQTIMRLEGRPAEDVETDNLFVKLFVAAYDELAATNDGSQDVRNMPSWRRALELWGLHGQSQTFSLTL
jgi:hypothetical protein